MPLFGSRQFAGYGEKCILEACKKKERDGARSQ